MNSAEMDLKRDQLIPSSSAVARLQELHQLMNSSLLYTKRLVGFMVFDQEGDKSGAISTLEDDNSMAQIKHYMEGEEGSTDSVQGKIRSEA